MGLLDIANRVHYGQILYRDFHILYGPLVALIPAWGLDLGLPGGAIFGFDAVVVAALLLLAAMITLPSRLTPAASFVLFAVLWLLIVAPMGDGGDFFKISWGVFYNRHAWAALCIILLLYLSPATPRPSDRWTDAVVLGLLILFELYVKITFGLVAAAFAIANMIVSPYNRAMSVRAIFVALLVATGLELAFHFHQNYLHDAQEFVARATGGDLWIGGIVRGLIDVLPEILACFGIIFAVRSIGRRTPMDILFVVGTIVALYMVRYSTGVGKGLVALTSVYLCMGELARRAELDLAPEGRGGFSVRRHLVSLGCLLLATLFIVAPMANQAIALEDFYAKVSSRDSGGASKIPQRLAEFIVPPNNDQTLLDLPLAHAQIAQMRSKYGGTLDVLPSVYMSTIIEGTQLLSSVDYRNHTVFTFDMVNPFTYALNMRPTRDGYPLFWIGGQWSSSADLLPKPEAVLGDADFVMVPRLPIAQQQLQDMQRVYGPYLKEHFIPAKESRHWELWARPTMR